LRKSAAGVFPAFAERENAGKPDCTGDMASCSTYGRQGRRRRIEPGAPGESALARWSEAGYPVCREDAALVLRGTEVEMTEDGSDGTSGPCGQGARVLRECVLDGFAFHHERRAIRAVPLPVVASGDCSRG